MSTLCAYENYLRDRYILGEPVRYMYGGFGGPNSGGSTSKPKQTVYGPDNEEYTYVDNPTSPNAGRYARQIGGKGGGKTVFLDEVQAASQKQQAEQPQNGPAQAVVETNNTENDNTRSAKMEPNNEATVSWEDLPSLIRTASKLAYSDYTSLEDGRKKLDDLLSNFHKLTEIPVSRDKMYYLETLRETFKNPAFIEAQSMFESPLFDEVKAEVSRKLSNLQAQKRYHSAGGEKDRRDFAKASAKEIAEWVRNADSKVANEIGKAALWEARRRLRDVKTSEEAYQILGITAAIFNARLSYLYDKTREVADQANTLRVDLKIAEKEASEQQIKDNNPAPQAEQVNADSGQHSSKKEATPQSNVDYSEFADAYKRYRAEDKKVASLKRKASKIQKAVSAPSSSATPEEIQSARESLAKIRGEISDSEKVKESLSSGLNSFTQKHNVVFIDGGDSFVVNPSPELLQGLKQRKSLQDRVKKARKKAEDAKKAGLKVNASEIASVADKLEGELNRVNDLLSQMFPNETVVSAVEEKPKRRPANKKKEPEESGAQFDASGLGLPGKSDVALKPGVAENKDAAYFVRRDLEATPKPEAEERVEEVDEVSETPSSEAPQRDDDATLERKVKESLGKGEPLRKKATRLRSKAKDAALKGRKEEAAGLRKQADEIEAEARKYIDEATNAGVELKNRRAEASQQPVPKTKEPVKKSEVPNSPVPEQQPEPVAAPVQEPPAKPRPERWTPLKSKMNDDDRRVVENTRKRLNFGLGDFAWRLANAKEKKDWQKAKELTVLAAQRYLEQARRAYRSHGGAEALAAFDESLSGEGLTVGQVRDRVVDKFRQLALMNVADLHKYAGERLDEWEAFGQGAELPSTKDKIALNHLLDKPHYTPNAVPYTPPEKGKIYEVPIDSLNLDPSRFQFKLNTNAQGVTDDLEGAEFDPMQAGIIHVWRDPDDGKDYVVNGHHRFNLAKNSGYDGKVNVRYIDADTADDAKAFGAVANIADSKGSATDVAEFIRTRGSDDIRTPGGKKIATKNKLLADGRVLSKLDETIFRKLKNGSIDEKTARVIAAELPDDKDKQLRLFADIERLELDASQAQDRAWAYASIQGEKQQGSLFGDDAPMEYDVESRSKLIGEIRKALSGAKRAAQAGGNNRNNEYWESQKLATNFDRDRAKQLSKSAGQTLDFFKDHIRLTGPMQNIIKEETDEYRKAIKAGKGAEKVVERAIERIKDVAQGGDGSVRRVEGLGLEYEDRLPSAKSEQTGQGVEAKGGGEKTEPPRTPSESLRNGTAGEVLETGGTDRPSNGGDGRNLASVIAEEAKKSDIPKNRVREELDAPRQSKTSTPQEKEKPDWLVALESQEDLKPVSGGEYNPNAKPYSWKAKFPETEDELREYWREHVDGGEEEEVSFGSDGERISVGEQSGDAPMTPDELRRFAQLRHGRELRKSLGLSEHFSEKELKKLQESDEKRGRGRPTKAPSEATIRVALEAQKSEAPKEQIQERITEALGTPSDTSKRKGSRRPQKNFNPDSIKDDVEKAIQIRDADRSYLSAESMESMMSIAKDVSDKHGIGGLKEFMRRIDVVPTARTRPQLLKELGAHLGEVSSNRFRATTIRKM